MKRWAVGICCMLTCFFCGFGIYASSSPYIDACDSVAGDAARTYSGFGAQISNFSDFSGWSACPDQTVLPMQEQAQQASAIYQVRGSETVEVSIYAKNSSFAMPTSYGGKYGAYVLGESERGVFSDAVRCRYDVAQDQTFLVDGGKVYLLRASPIGLYFSETDQSGLNLHSPFYGVNIAYSPDGSNFFELPDVRMTSCRKQVGGFYYYETYAAEVPMGASYIRVQLQKHRTIPGFDMPDAPVEQHLFLLSEVVFRGQSVEAGPVPEPPPSSSEPSAPEPPPSSSEPSAPEPPPSSSEPSAPEPPPSSSEPSAPEPPPSSSEPSVPEPPPSSSEPSLPEPPPSSSEPSVPDGPSIIEPPSSSEPEDISPSSSENQDPSSSEPQSSSEEESILGPDPERRPRPHRRRTRNAEDLEDDSPVILWGSADNHDLPPAPVVMMQQPQAPNPAAVQEQTGTELPLVESEPPASSSRPQVVVRTMGSQVGADQKKELPAVSVGAAAAGMVAMFLLGKRWKSSGK